MNNKPCLSVIVPVFNTSAYLSRCLDSLVGQTYHNMEIIVVNDGSTDDSLSIAEQYCKQYSNIQIVNHQVNRGLFNARVSGVKASKGDIIGFVDSDDYVSPDYYRMLINKMEAEHCDIVAGDTVRVTIDNKYYQYAYHLCALENNMPKDAEPKEAFFGQEGDIFSWHNIWNKIYTRNIWDKGLPYFEKLTEHLVMAEDLAFSSVLFFFANRFAHVSDCPYFYCEAESSATSELESSAQKLEKYLTDMNRVFRFIDSFLTDQQANSQIRAHFAHFRSYYHMLYGSTPQNVDCDSPTREKLKALVANLTPDPRDAALAPDPHDALAPGEQVAFFDPIQSTWYCDLEEIKQRILSDQTKVISFDIFDTLLFQPLWNPQDLFEFLRLSAPLKNNKNLKSFPALRTKAERSARASANPEFEDITLSEIYHALSQISGYSKDECRLLKIAEESLEQKLCCARKTGLALYELALTTGKPIVLVSDTYLEAPTVEQLLASAGYSGYARLFLSSRERKLKATGSLFRTVVEEMGVAPSDILHLGANWESDIMSANKAGLQTAFFPKAIDRFVNKVPGKPTNACANIYGKVENPVTTGDELWDKLWSNVAFRTLETLIANKLFDNPFRSWNEQSDLNADPYVAGYHSGGMYMVGLCLWMKRLVEKHHSRHIVFLSEGDCLPKRAFDLLAPTLGVKQVETLAIPSCEKNIPEGSIVFDLEYNDKVASVLQKCCPENTVFAYAIGDDNGVLRAGRKQNPRPELYCPPASPLSPLIREYFLSWHDDSSWRNVFPGDCFAQGVGDFLSDYVDFFGDYDLGSLISPILLSLPFEGMMLLSTPYDRKMAGLAICDNPVCGSRPYAPLHALWSEQVNDSFANRMFISEFLLADKSPAVRFFIYLLRDWKMLKVFVGQNLSNHPKTLRTVKGIYRLLRKIYRRGGFARF